MACPTGGKWKAWSFSYCACWGSYNHYTVGVTDIWHPCCFHQFRSSISLWYHNCSLQLSVVCHSVPQQRGVWSGQGHSRQNLPEAGQLAPHSIVKQNVCDVKFCGRWRIVANLKIKWKWLQIMHWTFIIHFVLQRNMFSTSSLWTYLQLLVHRGYHLSQA